VRSESNLRAGFVTDGVSVYHAATGWSLYQERFDPEPIFGKADKDTEVCTPNAVGHSTVWFQPGTDLIFVEVVFMAAPCFCSSENLYFARRRAQLPEFETRF
jgi:hypothetical protein